MAAAAVSGVAALILHYDGGHNLGIGGRADRALVVKNILRHSAKDLGLPPNQQGQGLVTWTDVQTTLDAIANGSDYVDNYQPVP